MANSDRITLVFLKTEVIVELDSSWYEKTRIE